MKRLELVDNAIGQWYYSQALRSQTGLTQALIHLLRRKAKETRNLVDKAVLGWYYNQASTGKRLRKMVFEN